MTLFACEYCYGAEAIVGGIAASGVVIPTIWCFLRRMFRRPQLQVEEVPNETETEHCCEHQSRDS
jgi:hypothetical protein